MREMTDRLGRRPGARRRLPRGPRGLPRRPGRARRRARDRRDLRRRDARPGQVPARAGRPRARRRAGRQPARRRGARRAAASGGRPGRACRAARRARTGERRMSRVAAIDCGTNSIRLLVADLTAGPVRDAGRVGAGWRSSGSARASTRPGGSPPRRWPAPSPGGRIRRAVRRAGVERVRFWRRRRPVTPQRRGVRRRRPRSASASTPEVLSGHEEAALSSRRHRRAAGAGARPPGGRHRGRVHRAGARRRARERGRVDGHRLRPAPRAAPAGDPPTAAEVAAGDRRHRRRTSTRRRGGRPARRRGVVGLRDDQDHGRGALDLPFYDRDAIDGGARGRRGRAAFTERCWR